MATGSTRIRRLLDWARAKLALSRGAQPGARREAPVRPSLDRPSIAPPRKTPPQAEKRVAESAPRRRAAAPPPTFSSRLAVVDGAQVHAVERPGSGRKSDVTVVLIHGAGVDHRDWTFRFMEQTPRSWPLLVFDRPGFGKSDRPRGASAALPASQARRLRAAARLFGAERVVVVGHSWGGAVAMAWALDALESTVGVVSLAGAVAPWSFGSALENGRRIREAARASLGAGGMRAAAEAALAESFDPQPVPKGYVDHIATELTPLSGPAVATMADVSTINGALSLLTPRYPELARPVELVYGDADAILDATEQGGGASALLPQARLTVLPGVGHMVHHAAPETCVAAIERIVSAA